MEIENPPFPYFTWDCANDLEDRFKKTLYHGGKRNCMGAVSPVALTDLAVSIYVAAAPSPKRKLNPGYIGSVAKRLAINPCTMMLGLLYCERLRQINPEYLNKISSSDLFVISLVISSKFINDEGEDDEILNDEWAEAGGLAVSTVNRLEREFLDAIQWKAYVSPQEFLHFSYQLETRIALKNGMLRGWFSYTDLTRILAQMHYLQTVKMALQNGLKVVLGCTLMYGLSLGVILSSAVCLNASYAQNAALKPEANSLHTYSDRPITRARQSRPQSTCDGDMKARISNQVASDGNMTDPAVISRRINDCRIKDNNTRFRNCTSGSRAVQATRRINVRWKMHLNGTSVTSGNAHGAPNTTIKNCESATFCSPSSTGILPSPSNIRTSSMMSVRANNDYRIRPTHSCHEQSKEKPNERRPSVSGSSNSSSWSKLDILSTQRELKKPPFISHVLFVEQPIFPIISGFR